jgi:predicted ATPase
MGQPDRAARLMDIALQRAQESGERWYEPELHRIKGEFLLAESVRDETQAEACFERACNLARNYDARSLELRAALSLGRLWRKQGKALEARRVLSEIYESFSEGFDTDDLKEARALLNEVS